jgi:hypothetical protein
MEPAMTACNRFDDHNFDVPFELMKYNGMEQSKIE